MSGHISALIPSNSSPKPSPSRSLHWDGSEGYASAVPIGGTGLTESGSDHPSPSPSGQPSRSSVDVPDTDGHSSESTPSKLSPKPSPSLSNHCVDSVGKASSLSSIPSPSESTPAKTQPSSSTAAPKVVSGQTS